MTRVLVVMCAIAVFGTLAGWLARDMVTRPSTVAASPRPGVNRNFAPAQSTPNASSARAGTFPPTWRHDPRPLLRADVYTREEVDRSSTDAIFVSKGAVSRLELEALVRLIGDNDGKSLVACLRNETELEEAVVEWRIVSTEERIAILDVALIEPMASPEEATCIDELMRGLEVEREPYHPPFLRGEQRRTKRVPLGIGLGGSAASEGK